MPRPQGPTNGEKKKKVKITFCSYCDPCLKLASNSALSEAVDLVLGMERKNN